jgi:hypothetical protein
VTVKHLFTADKSFGATEKIVSVTKKTLSAADQVLSAVLMILSVAKQDRVGHKQSFCPTETTVLMAIELSVVPKFRPFDAEFKPFIK